MVTKFCLFDANIISMYIVSLWNEKLSDFIFSRENAELFTSFCSTADHRRFLSLSSHKFFWGGNSWETRNSKRMGDSGHLPLLLPAADNETPGRFDLTSHCGSTLVHEEFLLTSALCLFKRTTLQMRMVQGLYLLCMVSHENEFRVN